MSLVKKVRLTRRAGQPGTKKLLERYGDDLICVRYRYDAERGQRIKSVEIAVERTAWTGRAKDRAPDDSSIVRVRLAEEENLLRRAVLLAGGRWDEESDLWALPRSVALGLGLKPRIVQKRSRGWK